MIKLVLKNKLFIIIGIVIVVLFGLFTFKRHNKTVDDDIFNLEKNIENKKIGVAYFSINDDTKAVAEKFSEIFECDLVEIVPEKKYSEEDLNFDDENSRVYLEDNINLFHQYEDETSETYALSEGIIIETTEAIEENSKKQIEMPKVRKNNLVRYDILIIGFPKWYDNAPKVIYSYLQNSKKQIVIPFCTGGDMGSIDQYIAEYVDDSVTVMSGKEFNRNSSEQELREWITLLSADFQSP